MRVTMQEVARAAGVSRSAVSNFLNRPELVSVQSARRIAAAIEQLGYIPNAAARSLRATTSQTVGLVVLDAFVPFFSLLAQGVEDAAVEEGWAILSANSSRMRSREKQHLELFASWNVDGVIIYPTGDISASLDMLRSRGIGSVLVGEPKPAPHVNSVWVDDLMGGRLAGEHLVETGCKMIAFVGDMRQNVIQARFQGLSEAVARFKEVSVRLIDIPTIDVGGGVDAGRRIVREMASTSVDGVFASTDLVAIGLLQTFLHAGLDVPDEISIVGYDDIPASSQQVVPLSTIHVPAVEIGRTAVTTLAAALEKGRASGAGIHRHFRPALVQRDSTRPRTLRRGRPVP